MKKFIEEILNNQTFLDILYNFGSFYKGFDYLKNMHKNLFSISLFLDDPNYSIWKGLVLEY